ncbi:hypothetical protein HanIR_Chr09g0448011 [Helianthus annuus]|nr:hypothetical protein HanIR_Chr09g0448011 [Helianthus annuus]
MPMRGGRIRERVGGGVWGGVHFNLNQLHLFLFFLIVYHFTKYLTIYIIHSHWLIF